jgi:predicted RND superfamily exporter protein
MPDIEQAVQTATTTSLSEARERSLNDDLHQLAQDARVYAEAEFQFQKSRAAYTVSASKSIILYALLACVLVFFAIMALVVGLVIALAPLITPWGSTAVVTLGLLGLAAFLLLRAKGRVSVLMKVFGEGDAK